MFILSFIWINLTLCQELLITNSTTFIEKTKETASNTLVVLFVSLHAQDTTRNTASLTQLLIQDRVYLYFCEICASLSDSPNIDCNVLSFSDDKLDIWEYYNVVWDTDKYGHSLYSVKLIKNFRVFATFPYPITTIDRDHSSVVLNLLIFIGKNIFVPTEYLEVSDCSTYRKITTTIDEYFENVLKLYSNAKDLLLSQSESVKINLLLSPKSISSLDTVPLLDSRRPSLLFGKCTISEQSLTMVEVVIGRETLTSSKVTSTMPISFENARRLSRIAAPLSFANDDFTGAVDGQERKVLMTKADIGREDLNFLINDRDRIHGILILAYASWCKTCDDFISTVWSNLLESVTSQSDQKLPIIRSGSMQIMVTSIDGSFNDPPIASIDGWKRFPSLYYSSPIGSGLPPVVSEFENLIVGDELTTFEKVAAVERWLEQTVASQINSNRHDEL